MTGNECKVSIQALNWATSTKKDCELLNVNIVIAADCCYDPDLIEVFVPLLEILLSSNNNSIAIISSTLRNETTYDYFIDLLKKSK